MNTALNGHTKNSPPNKMNEAHWNGSRVYFFDRSNKTIYGTVVDSNTREGTRLLVIRTEAGECISLPAAGVTLISDGSAPP
ncbi:hypothetical protein M378DRAFT_6567 [Amanita muscaria Koide BX008]|uniref:Uncharacterized protein n=1 Tax=Amanita muscaria (strain Koide BX008) TaxID=946122 RepID=A0A0C2TTH4_AMAMK|nr:hypothetical protein M378DRAFT_6567 [Amanita muscaria Koide BX008]